MGSKRPTLEQWNLSKGNDFYNFIDEESAAVIRSETNGNTVSVRVLVQITTPDGVIRKGSRAIKMRLSSEKQTKRNPS